MSSGPKYPDPAHRERLLADFVETAGVGLHWVASDGTILWANPVDYEPLGYTAGEYIGHNITEFHADEQVIGDILRRLSGGERLRDYEARLRCKDGSFRHVLINSSVLFDEDGKFVHTRCFTNDITERKRLDEAREQFVSILGHDLRNPLSAITVAAGSMLDATDLPDRHRRAVGRIVRGADRMSRMIADLLDFARGRMGGGIPVHPQPCDMGEVCRHAVDEIVCARPDRQVSVEIHGDTTGHWDRDRVAQVVSNLVGNALEHGADPIVVRCVGREQAVQLSVSNQGPPIDTAAIPNLFHPFSREPGKGERTGLGLGLFIVAEVVRAHAARIQVTSTEADGTTFAIEWPRH